MEEGKFVTPLCFGGTALRKTRGPEEHLRSELLGVRVVSSENEK